MRMPYDPLLSGPLNLYNVTYALLLVAGFAITVALIVGSLRHRSTIPRGWRLILVAASMALLGTGILFFAWLLVAGPVHDFGDQGLFWAVPIVYLCAVAVLAALRPARAAVLLIVSATVGILVSIALGMIATTIDPRWGEDQIDAGATALMVAVFVIPAALTGVLLYIGAIAGPRPGSEQGPPRPA
jgi:hypothetical protein